MVADAPTRVALYCRVSTEDQAQAGTIENQQTWLRRYCDLHGHHITGEYIDDGVSGAIPLGERPSGSRLLQDARERAFDLVLTYRVDRISRGRLVYLLQTVETLDALHVGLKSATEEFNTQTAMGRMVLAILGSFAEMERETILERTYMGKVRRAGQGRFPGGGVPYGYRLVDGQFVIQPDEAAVVRRIYRLYCEGVGQWRILHILNAEGAPLGQRGKLWREGRINVILHCRSYYGEHHYGRLVMACPPIISRETFDAAARQRQENALLSGRNTRHRVYLLKSLVFCGVCGLRYAGRTDSRRARQSYYYCRTRQAQKGCPGPHVPVDVLEDYVWEQIVAFAKSPGAFVAELNASLHADMQDAEQAESEFAMLEQAATRLAVERQSILTLYRKNRITESDLNHQLDALDREQAAIDGQREALAAKLLAYKARENAIIRAEQTLVELQEHIDGADEARKYTIMHEWVERVTVHPDRSMTVEWRLVQLAS